MDIVQLEYFKAVAESGHLTNAARKLNIAQPALSVSIARLESELGVSLFDRAGRGIYLNKCGEIYLEYVENALEILKKGKTELDNYCEKLENILDIGVISKPFPQMMISNFKEEYPESKIRQITILPENIEEELMKENVDYIISGQLSSLPGLVGELIWEEKMMLAVPSHSKWAVYPSIRLEQVKDEPFICLPKGYEYRQLMDQMCENVGFIPDVVKECFHCHVLELVVAGIGIALISEERARAHAGNSQIRLLEIENEGCTMKHYLEWKAGHHFSKLAKEFKKYVAEYYKDYQEDCESPFCNCK